MKIAASVARGEQQAVTQLRVELVHEVYRDPAFAVVRGIDDERQKEVVLVGPLPELATGETVSVTGRFTHHPKHGERFRVEHVEVEAPTSDTALIGYLAQVKYIGERGATVLVQRHGSEVLEKIDADPEKLLGALPGVGKQRLPAVVESWHEVQGGRKLFLLLQRLGVPAAEASRVRRALGEKGAEIVERDPYRLATLDGVGFLTADRVARAVGIPEDAPERLDAGIEHSLKVAESDGHCYLTVEQLQTRAEELLERSVGERIGELTNSGRLVLDEDRIYLPVLYGVEQRLARNIAAIAGSQSRLSDLADSDLDSKNFVPNELQAEGIRNALNSRVAVLTGGPGTGKTASMAALVRLLKANSRRVVLCAPTGKAARRLSELTGAEAMTIHRLLGYSPAEGFTRDEEDQLEAAMVIVDEASMMDVYLADALFRAIGEKTHVLLVGDQDQLPSVGPGRVLEELIDSGSVPSICLTEIVRQAAGSLIVVAAHQINSGEVPGTDSPDGGQRDFFVIERDSAEDSFAEIISLVTERLPRHYSVNPVDSIQVLSPMRKGPLGTNTLNNELRAVLNPDGKVVASGRFRVGDRLIQTRNDYEHELMNGEIVTLLSDDRERRRAIVRTDDGRTVTLDHGSLETFELAYAITIHKSQGSQAPIVVVPVHTGHYVMLSRNLFYTAVTRAEQTCVVVGQPRALQLAVSRRTAGQRNSALAQRVSELATAG